ncbi:MAG: LamG domain-containing protein [Thermofilaceae archaeon]
MSARRVLRAGGLWFDGVDDYVHVTDGALVSPNRDFSVTMWVCLSPAAPIGVWRTLWREGPGTTRHLGLDPGGYLRFQIQTADRVWHDAIDSARFPRGSWQFITAVFSTLYGMKLYRNASLVASNPNNLNNISGAGVDIGSTPPNNIWWYGFIDDVRIYNRALSDDEIRAIYERDALIRDGLVLHLDFSEYEGSIAYDKSGCGNHATIYGARWVVKKPLRVLQG